MNRADANRLHAVAPRLAAWQEAKAERDRIDLDGRYGAARRRAAAADARVAEQAYDDAVRPLLSDSMQLGTCDRCGRTDVLRRHGSDALTLHDKPTGKACNVGGAS